LPDVRNDRVSGAEREAKKKARKEASRIGGAQGQSLEQELLRSSPLEGLGKLCLSTPGPLLPKVSLARRRQKKDLRLHLQHKCQR